MIYIIVFIVVVFVFLMVAYYFQEKLIFIPEKLPEDYQYDFEGVWKETFIEVDVAKLNAIHFKVPNPEGVVLYFHGNSGSLSSWGYVGLDFVRLNLDVVVVDYRGFGKSTGTITNEKILLDDAQKVYNWVVKQYPEDKITVYGRSLGSGVASYIASKNNPKMVILETPYISLHKLGGEIYLSLISKLMKYKLPTNEFLKNVNCPVYIFHGTADELIGYHHAKELERHKNVTKLYTFKEGSHNNLPEFPDYHIALAEIFSNKE